MVNLSHLQGHECHRTLVVVVTTVRLFTISLEREVQTSRLIYSIKQLSGKCYSQRRC